MLVKREGIRLRLKNKPKARNYHCTRVDGSTHREKGLIGRKKRKFKGGKKEKKGYSKAVTAERGNKAGQKALSADTRMEEISGQGKARTREG